MQRKDEKHLMVKSKAKFKLNLSFLNLSFLVEILKTSFIFIASEHLNE